MRGIFSLTEAYFFSIFRWNFREFLLGLMPKKAALRSRREQKKGTSLSPKKVLVLGSGALKIGEAGEFDYSGSQAIKALKEEGFFSILVNPNIATIQTSEGMADKVYFLPVNPYFVEQIIEKEKPYGILLSFGGQTALNCGIALEKSGVLKKHGVKVLGTPVSAIWKTEDRELFKQEIESIGLKVPKSLSCTTMEEGKKAVETIGYPVIVRAAFTLGGRGSGFAYNWKELEPLLETAFSYSPQVLIEENLKGWKELEYEVVRDQFDNCIVVCNMENFDPLGIHTGESIVIAPSQTLNNHEYHFLREMAIKAIRHFGIVGECNIQFALDPQSDDYRVIEVNARLSRSSALASKATGYPLAHVAAKLSMGYRLSDLKNAVTKDTTACFEPALDYVALKIPRWDLDKFRLVSQEISTEMKSVGEIMALGRSFEEVMQKGLRMLQVGLHGFVANEDLGISTDDLESALKIPTPRRIVAIAEALHRGWSVEKIAGLTKIDRWFLEKLSNIVETEKQVCKEGTKLSRETFVRAKRHGFSDKQIGNLLRMPELDVRKKRKQMKIFPVVKQIDTTGAEHPAKTNYLYLTYHGEKDDVTVNKKKQSVIVLGSGPYCIGSSVEFDWCCVNALKTAGKKGYETIMINYNPETVSTDYDICDKLYFDELSVERVLDIYEKENPFGVVVSTGGQIPNNLAMKLGKSHVKILGTDAKSIDRAEDRHKFSQMMDKLGIDQPRWKELKNLSEVESFATEVGYPVLVRPSYVLSGAAMRVAQNADGLRAFLNKAARVSPDAPVVVSKFEMGAKEVEIDAVAYKGELVLWAIAEHIENAGVHSGDATIVLPPQKLYIETIRRVKYIAKQIAKELNITGPFNIQFLAKNNDVKVIECNLRASRSFPFSSKVTGYNFIETAAKAMLGDESVLDFKVNRARTLDLDHVGVKAPQFSFPRLKGADPVLGVEMASTGEVACFGDDLYEAFLKAMISVGFVIPKKNILVSIGRIEDKADFLPIGRALVKMGFVLFGTEGTAKFLNRNEIPAETLHKISSGLKPNLLDALSAHEIHLVINIPKNYDRVEETDGYLIRRKSVDLNIPLLTNIQVAKIMTEALGRYKLGDLKIEDWRKYVPEGRKE